MGDKEFILKLILYVLIFVVIMTAFLLFFVCFLRFTKTWDNQVALADLKIIVDNMSRDAGVNKSYICQLRQVLKELEHFD